MIPMFATTTSEALDNAFRAAFLLTGSADLAEHGVLNGIASLEPNDHVEDTLLAITIESVIRQYAMALLPHELQHLIQLAPRYRNCFLLRVLFRIPVPGCVVILRLTTEEFEDSLRAAFEQLPLAGALISPDPIDGAKGAQ